MAQHYTKIKYILDKITQHPLLQDITLEQVVDQTVNFMRIVGVPKMFTEKVEKMHIVNYKALLPCDYYNVIQVRDRHNKPFRYATDNFHYHEGNDENNLTYKIQGNMIFTSIRECDIEVAYSAIITDEEGYPLIPDNSSFTRALELFIKKHFFTILFDLGKISQAALQNAQQEYAWAVGDCQTEFNRIKSVDEMEAFFNNWRTLLIKDHHRSGFVNSGNKEHIKIH